MRRSALSRLPPPLRGRLMSTRSRWRTGELTRGLFLSGTTATRLPGDCAAHIDAFGSDVLPTAGAVRVDVAAISELGDTDLVVGVCEESCVGRAWGVSLLRRALVTAAVDRRAQQALRRQHANAEMAHRARLEAGTAPPLAADRERRTRGLGYVVCRSGESGSSGGRCGAQRPCERGRRLSSHGRATRRRRARLAAVAAARLCLAGRRRAAALLKPTDSLPPCPALPCSACLPGGARAPLSPHPRRSPQAHGLLCFEIEGGELTFYSDGERVDLPPLRGLPPAVRPWARLSAAGDSAEILQVRLVEWGVGRRAGEAGEAGRRRRRRPSRPGTRRTCGLEAVADGHRR